MPSARIARLRVINKVREALWKHKDSPAIRDNSTYIHYYAFSSALEEVIEELGKWAYREQKKRRLSFA